jgi:AcrR family transcriptional regulator
VHRAVQTREPPTQRGKARRDQIIEVATQLFNERGFHATGIDDVGAAAGITGPGIYRYFASKDEILIAVFDRVWMMLKEAIEASRTLEPIDALDHLMARHVRLSVVHRAEFTLLAHDLRYLPSSYQTLARTNHATYRDAWADAIVTVRTEITLDEARLMTTAAWRLSSGIGEAIDQSNLASDRIEMTLLTMTRSAVLRGAAHL